MCAGLLAIAVITIVVLVILLVKCHNGDNYQHQHNNCGTCQGLGEKVCVDRPKLHALYGDGILTETSNLMRGKQWPVTMPDDQWASTNGRETSPGWSKSFGDLEAYQGPTPPPHKPSDIGNELGMGFGIEGLKNNCDIYGTEEYPKYVVCKDGGFSIENDTDIVMLNYNSPKDTRFVFNCPTGFFNQQGNKLKCVALVQ
jgi:hypothetical protein